MIETTVAIELLEARVDPAAYDRYEAAARANAALHGGDPMTRQQYDAAIRALTRNRRLNAAMTLLTLDVIADGRFLVDTRGQVTSCCSGNSFTPG